MNEIVNVVVGAVLPPLIDVLNAKVKNSNVRYAVSVVVCLVVGVLVNIRSLSVSSVLASGSLVFASAQTVYKTYWKGSEARKGVKKRLEGSKNK